MATNQAKFNQVCEAYDVLSNRKWCSLSVLTSSNSRLAANKAIYDVYGEYALKEGIVTPEGSK